MKNPVVLASEITLVILVIAVVVVGFVKFGSGGETSEVVKNEIRFSQYSNAARSYRARNYGYEGVCHAVGLPDSTVCIDSRKEYRMEETLDSGGFVCADSSGFVGVTEESGSERFSCL